jgi:hypothetical protein
MVHINDLAQIVGPVRTTMRFAAERPPARRIAPRQRSRDRREQIAAVKAGREAFRLPVDLEAPRAAGAALNQLEKTVARANIPAAIGL